MRKHKPIDTDLLLTSRHGGIIHTLESFESRMFARMKCGLILSQWRNADSTGRKCKRCAKNPNATSGAKWVEGITNGE